MTPKLIFIVFVLLLSASTGCVVPGLDSDDSDRGPSTIAMNFNYESGDRYVVNGTVDVELITDTDARFNDVTSVYTTMMAT